MQQVFQEKTENGESGPGPGKLKICIWTHLYVIYYNQTDSSKILKSLYCLRNINCQTMVLISIS